MKATNVGKRYCVNCGRVTTWSRVEYPRGSVTYSETVCDTCGHSEQQNRQGVKDKERGEQ